ncbi:hypothetical protein ACLKA7_001946 [Drosophila subpalustris]
MTGDNVAGQQEAQDERPSTSAAAAAKLSTSSAPTEPRASYASVAKKVKVAALPVDYPQVNLSHVDLSALEEALLDEVILTGWDTAVSFTGIHFRVGHLVIDCTDEIEEQMTMSSQEISDELEDSRPPSSCSMEPLLYCNDTSHQH